MSARKLPHQGVRFDKSGGILPCVAQDYQTDEILMLAYMNAESFQKTLESGEAVYYSRSRRRLWHKGESSGHVQRVRDILIDCDGDAILLRVEQVGAACHKGYRSCFFRRLTDAGFEKIAEKVFDPDERYGEQREDDEFDDE